MRIAFLLLLLIPSFIRSQALPTIEDKTKNMKPYTGFFNFYWDEHSSKIWIEINKLDTEILYQTSLPAGLGSNDVGLDRGVLGSAVSEKGGTYIVKFSKVGNKILMIEPNYHFRAVTTDAAEKRAVEQSFAQSTLWGFTVEAESHDAYLVDATAFLFRDALQISRRLQDAKQGTYTLDASRSAMYLARTKDFPLNTEFETTVTFVAGAITPGNYVSSVAPASEAVTLRVHHSFVQLPDSHFIPRVYDARCPYITQDYFDYSTPIAEPIEKKFILRHRLEKKDPSAAVSEAVKPIVYYLDNGTPEPIRSALLEGASWWNQAFEAAGFKNAFQVKVLPDSSDPMDLRYNMINWVHRSTRGWSFGYAVSDPRTGEIIKGNVTLGSLRVRQDYLIAQGLLSPFDKDTLAADDKMLDMSLARLKQLAAHEVGHTLGLMHNYIASTQNRASVMDYPSPTVKLNKQHEIDLTDAYTGEIGDWDKVSINYGYRQFDKGTDEKTALNTILSDASKKGLTFISDRDARDPAGLHPNAHLWDVGTDPVTALKEVMQIREKALQHFGENSIRKGTPYALLEDVLVPVYLFHRYQIEAVTKQVGGMYYTYAVKGDGQTITKPVSREQQLSALQAIIDCMNPKALAIPESIIKLIPPRPAAYDYNRELFSRRTGLAFDPLSAAEAATEIPFSFLFNTSRLNRMVQYQAENNGLGVDEMLNLLLEKVWKAPAAKGLEGLIQQQNAQLLLTYMLAASVNENASFAVRADLANAIDIIKTTAEGQLKTATNSAIKGYLLLTLDRIKTPEKAKTFTHITVAPGSPIGCGMD
jgi:hypothetical protein